MDLADLLETRHSCRAFLPTPVPDEVIERLFSLAQRTPSSCNTQPWRVHLVSGRAIAQFGAALTEYAEAHVPDTDPDIEYPAGYPGVYGDRRRESGYGLYSSLGIERHDRARRTAHALQNYSFFGAPHTAIITSAAELGGYGLCDTGAYINTVLLVAQELGLATLPQGAVAVCSSFIHEKLAIPHTESVVCAVSFGYEDPLHAANTFRTGRAELGAVLQRIDAWPVADPTRASA